MQRREFINLLGGAAAAWPLAARAQQDGRVRRIGMMVGGPGDDPEYQKRVAAFRDGLAKLGWIEDRNLKVDLRFAAGNFDRLRAQAAELAGLAPEVIVVSNTVSARAVHQYAPSIPIVFNSVTDPVATGLVGSVARPGGNATGFALLEPSIGSKWVELLKEAAPGVARIAFIFNPENNPENTQAQLHSAIEAAASVLGVNAIRTPVRNVVDIVRAIDAIKSEPNGGLLMLPDSTSDANRETIIRLAAQYRLPSIHWAKVYATEGGLMTYGTDMFDLYQRTASYVDRILRGSKPGDLPVQFPTKFEFVINLKTAKALGLKLPEALLVRATEVIE